MYKFFSCFFKIKYNLFLYFSIHAAIVALMIVIQENAKAGRDAARKSDYGVGVNGSRRTFFVRFFKRNKLP